MTVALGIGATTAIFNHLLHFGVPVLCSHTKGCTTWTTKVRDRNKVYDIDFLGSQSALAVAIQGRGRQFGNTVIERHDPLSKKLVEPALR
jgi:hypothetical protein